MYMCICMYVCSLCVCVYFAGGVVCGSGEHAPHAAAHAAVGQGGSAGGHLRVPCPQLHQQAVHRSGDHAGNTQSM